MKWLSHRDYDRALAISLCVVVGEEGLPRPPRGGDGDYDTRWGWILRGSEEVADAHVLMAITPRGSMEIAEFTTAEIVDLSDALRAYADRHAS